MSQNIVFLGWDKPWTELFAGWLEREPDRLRRRLVVVPTRESGRRLREWLVSHASKNGSGAILGPRVATPDDFFRAEESMPDAIRWAGWLTVLRTTQDDEVADLFPGGMQDKDDVWRLAVVRQIEQARESLMSGNVDFAEVARSLPEDNARWLELARLEKRVVSVWKKWGGTDPVRAKGDHARNPVRPPCVDEIILAGVTDPTWLAVEAWRRLGEQNIPITILVGAPAELKPAFDEWGRPLPEFWSDRRQYATPGPTRALVAADAVALAEAVVQTCTGKSNRDVAIGVCDSTFAPAIARRFQEAGWPTFDPEGILLAKDGWPELLEALAGAMDAPDSCTAIVRVARHPVVWAEWLKDCAVKATFAVLDKWEAENAASDLVTSIGLLCNSSDEDKKRQAAKKAAGELLKKVHGLVREASSDRFDVIEKKLQLWLQAVESQVASRAMSELESWPQLRGANFGLSLRLKWLAASLASVSRNADSSDAVLALQGWLELPFDPAAHLILAGLHEGSVPEAPAADPLITEAVREKFGLRDRKSRLAREIFLYTAMVEGRRANGSTTVITAQVDAQGEPCKPSRVLLQARPELLPERVLNFVKEIPDVPLLHTPPWSRANWKLRPPADAAANKKWTQISPSALKDYLACPTRFYFKRVLGWDNFTPFEGELDSRQFGDLIHAVLKEWGNNPEARELADAKDLRSYWLSSLKQLAAKRFGSTIPSLIQLQLMSAEERLVALADKQAEQRQAGWHVVAVEKELNDVLTLGGLPVKMRVDRIDRHDDGRVRVIDYKTGKSSADPFKAHLCIWSEEKHPAPLATLWTVKTARGEKSHCWTDLQLPLYVAAVQKEMKLAVAPEAFYALLPDAVSDMEFVPFENVEAMVDNAMQWAENAAQRIIAGVFWPPAPEVKYDDLAALAPEGLEQALGEEWAKFLAGNQPVNGGKTP
jgi:ATP-dependent helicase/nuclease subunit B